MLNCIDPTKADERYSLDLCGILADFYRHGERSKLEVFNLKFAEYTGLPITCLRLTPSVQNGGSILVDPRSAAFLVTPFKQLASLHSLKPATPYALLISMHP